MRRQTTAALVAAGFCAALLGGCQRETPKAKQVNKGAAVKPVAEAPARPKVPPIVPPEVQPPAVAKGARVVHLVYTSNNDGEVDPCG